MLREFFRPVSLDMRDGKSVMRTVLTAGLILWAVLLLLWLLPVPKAHGAAAASNSPCAHGANKQKGTFFLSCRLTGLKKFSVSASSKDSRLAVQMKYTCRAEAVQGLIKYYEKETLRSYNYGFGLPKPNKGSFVCYIVLEGRMLNRHGHLSVSSNWAQYA